MLSFGGVDQESESIPNHVLQSQPQNLRWHPEPPESIQRERQAPFTIWAGIKNSGISAATAARSCKTLTSLASTPVIRAKNILAICITPTEWAKRVWSAPGKTKLLTPSCLIRRSRWNSLVLISSSNSRSSVNPQMQLCCEPDPEFLWATSFPSDPPTEFPVSPDAHTVVGPDSGIP